MSRQVLALRFPSKVVYDGLQRHIRISCCGVLPEDEGAVTLAGCVGSCAVFRLDGEAAADVIKSLHDVARVTPFTNNTVAVLSSAFEQWDSLVRQRHDAVRALAVVWAKPVVEEGD
jgi:hypothetical protein